MFKTRFSNYEINLQRNPTEAIRKKLTQKLKIHKKKLGSSALRAHNFRQFRQISNLHRPPKKIELKSFKNITKIGSLRVFLFIPVCGQNSVRIEWR